MNTPTYAQATAVAALLGVASSSLVIPLTAQAQDAGGIQTRLNLSGTVSSSRNPGLLPGDGETSLQEQGTVDYNYRSATRTETFNLNARGSVRSFFLEGLDDITFTPQVALSYERAGASSSLSLQANASRTDISYSNPLTDFLDAEGNLVLPDDFDEIEGTGTRLNLGFSASLSLRDDAPFGITLNAAVNDLSYSDVSSTALIDNRTISFGATGRFDINDAVSANLGLRYRTTEEADGETSDNLALTGSVSFAQPSGPLGLSFNINNIDENPSVGLQVNRALELPAGTLSGSLGVSQAGNDDIFATGSLGWRQELTRGALSAKVNRSIRQDADDNDEVLTSLSLGTTYAVSPTGTLALDANYAQTEQASDGSTTALSEIGASYTHAFNDDWSLSAGASYRTRTSTGVEDATATSLSLTLSRTFEAIR